MYTYKIIIYIQQCILVLSSIPVFWLETLYTQAGDEALKREEESCGRKLVVRLEDRREALRENGRRLWRMGGGSPGWSEVPQERGRCGLTGGCHHRQSAIGVRGAKRRKKELFFRKSADAKERKCNVTYPRQSNQHTGLLFVGCLGYRSTDPAKIFASAILYTLSLPSTSLSHSLPKDFP